MKNRNLDKAGRDKLCWAQIHVADPQLSAGAHIRVLNVRCRSGAGITVWDSTN